MADKLSIFIILALIIVLLYFLRRGSLARVVDIKAYAEKNNGKLLDSNKELSFFGSIRTNAVSILLGYQFENNVKVYVAGICPGGSGGEFHQTIVEIPMGRVKKTVSAIFHSKKLLPIFINQTLFNFEMETASGVAYFPSNDEEIELPNELIELKKMGYTLVILQGKVCVYLPFKILSLKQIEEIVSRLE